MAARLGPHLGLRHAPAAPDGVATENGFARCGRDGHGETAPILYLYTVLAMRGSAPPNPAARLALQAAIDVEGLLAVHDVRGRHDGVGAHGGGGGWGRLLCCVPHGPRG